MIFHVLPSRHWQRCFIRSNPISGGLTIAPVITYYYNFQRLAQAKRAPLCVANEESLNIPSVVVREEVSFVSRVLLLIQYNLSDKSEMVASTEGPAMSHRRGDRKSSDDSRSGPEVSHVPREATGHGASLRSQHGVAERGFMKRHESGAQPRWRKIKPSPGIEATTDDLDLRPAYMATFKPEPFDRSEAKRPGEDLVDQADRKSIFVGGLAPYRSTCKLRELAGHLGIVTYAKVFESGTGVCGKLTFSTEAARNRALVGMDGQTVHGAEIRTNAWRGRQHTAEVGSRQKRIEELEQLLHDARGEARCANADLKAAQVRIAELTASEAELKLARQRLLELEGSESKMRRELDEANARLKNCDSNLPCPKWAAVPRVLEVLSPGSPEFVQGAYQLVGD